MSTQKNNAKLFDPSIMIQAGINPKTGLPFKMGDIGKASSLLKESYIKNFRIKDEQDAINTFVWYNLPNGLNARLLERILYYRGQGMFFYMKETDTFYFLPYALQSPDNGPGIDVYGRYRGCTPLPFNGSASQGGTGKSKDDKERPWITGLFKRPIYDIPLEPLNFDEIDEACILLKDYSEQFAQNNLSRQSLQEPIISQMAEIPCFARTALLNSTGVKGMRVANQADYPNVLDANNAFEQAAVNGIPYVPIVGSVDFQDLTDGQAAKAEEFLVELESLDNLRMSFHGIPNGGIFQKKAHMLETEAQMNAGVADAALRDRLQYRQDFCDLVNSVYGLGISVEIHPSLLGTSMITGDFDGDGDLTDNYVTGEGQEESDTDVSNE